MNRREWLVYSDMIDAMTARRHADCGESWEHGYEHGYQAGYLAACDELKKINALLPLALDVELARWGPRGRDGFGDPRPDDFPGK